MYGVPFRYLVNDLLSMPNENPVEVPNLRTQAPIVSSSLVLSRSQEGGKYDCTVHTLHTLHISTLVMLLLHLLGSIPESLS